MNCKANFINILLFCAVCYCLFPDATNATLLEIQPISIKDISGTEVGIYDESHALVIGGSDYTGGWPKLPGVEKDIILVKDALEAKGFNVVLVRNPNSQELVNAFEGFIEKYGYKANNRLLFYFAGHGHTIKPQYGGEALGYIVPVEAPNPYDDLKKFRRDAMSMQRIEEYALSIDAKHALFIFDSCFSGSLFALSRAVPEHISYKTAKPVRQFITSGSADERVPDTSIFRQQFIAALGGEGDQNGDGYLTGAELSGFIFKNVVNYSKGAQHPQYGKIRNPNLDKGDFVFQVATPIGAKILPTYFAGRTITGGVTKKTGEDFVIEMTKSGSAIATIYKKNERNVPRKRIGGSWWINDNEWVCFKIGKFNNGNKFCRIYVVEGEKEWLVSDNPARRKWLLQPR